VARRATVAGDRRIFAPGDQAWAAAVVRSHVVACWMLLSERVSLRRPELWRFAKRTEEAMTRYIR